MEKNDLENVIIDKLNNSYISDDFIAEISKSAKYLYLYSGNNDIELVNEFFFKILTSLFDNEFKIKAYLNTSPFFVIDYLWIGLYLSKYFPKSKLTRLYYLVLKQLLQSSVIRNNEWVMSDEFIIGYLSKKLSIKWDTKFDFDWFLNRSNLLISNLNLLEDTSIVELIQYDELDLLNISKKDRNTLYFMGKKYFYFLF